MTKQIRFTKEGFEQLQEQYKRLKASRPAAVEDLKKAREMGDLSENGYYKASKSKLAFIDSRMRKIAFDLKQAVVTSAASSDAVQIGTTVRISDGKQEITYQIVGDLEANPSEGKISLLSPLGRALDGKKEGENAELQTQMGITRYVITKIRLF